MLNGNVIKAFRIVSHIRKQQKEAIGSQTEGSKEPQLGILEPQAKDNHEYFNLRFFKVKKSSFVIAALALLVFILTIFCMKQQNDYALLMSEYHQQGIVLREIQTEVDSLRTVIKPNIKKKK